MAGEDLVVRAILEFKAKIAELDNANKKLTETGKAAVEVSEGLDKGSDAAVNLGKTIPVAVDSAKSALEELKAETEKLIGVTDELGESEGLKETERGAREAKEELTRADSAAKGLGKTLAKFLGGAALLAFAKSSIHAFADWERQLFATGVEARRLGLNVAEVRRHAEALTATIERQTGQLRQDTIGAFNRFLGITGDVQQATLLLNAAVGAQQLGYATLENAVTNIAGVMQGNLVQAAHQLSIELDDTKSAAEQQAQVFDVMIAKYLGAAEGADDLAGALGEINATTNEVKLTLGEQLAPAVEFVSLAMSALVKVVQIFGSSIGSQVSIAITAFKDLGGIIGQFLNFKQAATNPGAYFGKLTALAAESNKHILDGAAEAAQDIQDIWNENSAAAEQTEKQKAQAIEDIHERLNAELEAGQAKQAEKDVAAAADAAGKAAEAARKEAEAAAEAAADFNRNTQDQMLRAQLDATEEGSQERLDAELAILERMREQAVSEAERLNADVDMVNELFREMREQAIESREKKDKKERAKLFKQRFAEAKKAATDEIKIDEAKAQARIELERRVLEGKRDIALTIASQAVALGRALFGENKAVAIAETIINTAAGIMRAVVDPGGPAGYALAALIAATGAVQIAKIQSTEIGSGSVGGFGGGGAAGTVPTDPATQPAAPTVTAAPPASDQGSTSSTGDTINFNGPTIISDPELRRFMRKARRAESRDGSRSAA